jgi:hypothetical protein
MTESQSRQFTKQVAIKATNDDEQIATGLALTADEVDHQLDFFRSEGVEAMFNPDPDHGVMHGRFPEDDAELVRNEVLDEDEEIDGAQFEAGDWVVQRQYTDDDLWDLVDRGVLNGYSIGGEVTEAVEYDSVEDLPDDVAIPDAVDPDRVDEKYWPPVQVTNGYVSELSDVDIPAVVSAQFTSTKGASKSVVDDVAGEDEFVQVMSNRGHDETDARDLWSYLESAAKAGPADAMSKSQPETDPDAGDLDDEDVGFLKRLRRAVSTADPAEKSESDDDVSPEPGLSEVSEVALAKALDAAKEGRTLNGDNREALMAAHDAVEASLASEMDIETNRFTDDPDSDFHLSEYGWSGDDEDEGEKAAPVEKLTEEQGNLVMDAIQRFIDSQGEAPFGEFSSWVWTTDALGDDAAFAADEACWQYREYVREQRDETPITDDFADWVTADSGADAELTMSKDNPEGDEKSLPEQNAEALEDIQDTLKDLTADEESTDKNADNPDEDPSQAEKNAEAIGDIKETLDAISKQTGASQQLGGAEKGAGTDGEGGMSEEAEQFKKALGGTSGGDF